MDLLPHNWSSDVKVSTTFSTDVTRSAYTLAEARRSLTDRPFRTVELKWTALNQGELTRILMVLARACHAPSLVPLYSDACRVTSAAGTTINCVPGSRRFSASNSVVIFETNPADGRPYKIEMATVQTVGLASLTLTGALANTYGATATVIPLIYADVSLGQAATLRTDGVGEVAATFHEKQANALPALAACSDAQAGLYGTQSSNENPGAASTTPIFAVPIDWSVNVTLGVVRAGESYERGRQHVVQVDGARPQFNFEFQARGLRRDETFAVLQFFESRRGRLEPFWLVGPNTHWSITNIGLTSVTVSKAGALVDAQLFVVYVAIVQKNGTIYVRKINSVTDLGATWRFNFVNAIPALSVSDIARVTVAYFVRFSEDTLTEVWKSDEACDIQIRCTELLEEQFVDITPIVDPCEA